MDGTRIAGPVNITSALDRTLWLFKQRAAQYILISICTYGVAMLGIGALFFSGWLSLETLDPWYGKYWVNFRLLSFVLFVMAPGVLSDIALQHYTSHLVRNEEIKWYQALRKVLSVDVVNYILCKFNGIVVLALASGFGFVLFFIPILGWAAYFCLLVVAYTFLAGLTPAIIVEERKWWFVANGRNFQLCMRQFGVSAFGSSLGMGAILGLFLSGLSLVFIVGGLVATLLDGTSTLMVESNASERFFTNLAAVTFPLLMGLLFAPLSSIFYSVLYYSLRSKREGFHLENRIEAYRQQVMSEKVQQ
jgi:MFS family permease